MARLSVGPGHYLIKAKKLAGGGGGGGRDDILRLDLDSKRWHGLAWRPDGPGRVRIPLRKTALRNFQLLCLCLGNSVYPAFAFGLCQCLSEETLD